MFSAVLVLASLAAGASSEAPGTPVALPQLDSFARRLLFGGTALDPMLPYLGALVSPAPGGASGCGIGCGGVLVSPGVFLAAGHCLFKGTYPGPNLTKVRVVIGQKILPTDCMSGTVANGVHKVKAAYKHSMFGSVASGLFTQSKDKKDLEDDYAGFFFDVAVLYLEECSSQTPAKLAGADFNYSTPMEITEVGWGLDETGSFTSAVGPRKLEVSANSTYGNTKVDFRCHDSTAAIYTAATTDLPTATDASASVVCFWAKTPAPKPTNGMAACTTYTSEADCIRNAMPMGPWCKWTNTTAPSGTCTWLWNGIGPGPMDSGSPYFARSGSATTSTHVGIVSGGNVNSGYAINQRVSYYQNWMMEVLKRDKCIPIGPCSALTSYFDQYGANAMYQAPSAAANHVGGPTDGVISMTTIDAGNGMPLHCTDASLTSSGSSRFHMQVWQWLLAAIVLCGCCHNQGDV